MTGKATKAVWVFGDWRDDFQNRVSFQLLAKARELAGRLGGETCAVLLGAGLDRAARACLAHGAERVYVIEHPALAAYDGEVYARVLERLIRDQAPAIVLVGATDFGRELAARAAARLGTGLTADCVELALDPDGLLVMTAPAYGGNLLAETVMEKTRPQMATVRPGIFAELPADPAPRGQVERVAPPERMPANRVRLLARRKLPPRAQELAEARVVVCGGRGMGGRQKFRNLQELARLLGGEVGATRPAVHAGWAGEDSLVGQAGKTIHPKLLLSFGISGAIQHTAGIQGVPFTVAVNKNPQAGMMRSADVAIQGDANQVCLALIRELKARLES